MYDFPSSPSTGQIFAPAGGPSWVWDGAVWKNYQTAGETAIARTFIPGSQSAAVTYDYVKPANLRHVEFEGVAAGGSGACAIATGASTWSFGSGGGGGSWGKKLFQAAALPATVTITIGRPGQGVSSGSGQTANNTTFGSLITLPGGSAGIQGANTVYSSWGSISGAPTTAMPTGCDVAQPGEPADAVNAGMAMSNAAGNVAGMVGRSGGSPWGKGVAAGLVSTGFGPSSGTGYGWGSSGCLNAGSSALKSSLTAGTGAVLLTEYLAVAPADVAAPLRQTFYPSASGVTITVPPTAKHARISGKVYAATQPMALIMRLSADGSTFLAGATDYYVGGTNTYSGSTASPAKQPIAGTNAWTLTPSSDSLNVPHLFQTELAVNKPASPAIFGYMNRGGSFNASATLNHIEYLWTGYTNVAALANITQLPAFQIIPASGTILPANSVIIVDWIY